MQIMMIDVKINFKLRWLNVKLDSKGFESNTERKIDW